MKITKYIDFQIYFQKNHLPLLEWVSLSKWQGTLDAFYTNILEFTKCTSNKRNGLFSIILSVRWMSGLSTPEFKLFPDIVIPLWLWCVRNILLKRYMYFFNPHLRMRETSMWKSNINGLLLLLALTWIEAATLWCRRCSNWANHILKWHLNI